MYRSSCENIYPAEIERILFDHPKISQVAIIGLPDEKWTEVGKAFILPKKREKLNKEEVLEFLKGKAAKFKIPGYVQFVDRLHMSAGDKVKRIGNSSISCGFSPLPQPYPIKGREFFK